MSLPVVGRFKPWSWMETSSVLARVRSSSGLESWPTWRKRGTWRSQTSSFTSKPSVGGIWRASKRFSGKLIIKYVSLLSHLILPLFVSLCYASGPLQRSSSSSVPWRFSRGTVLPTWSCVIGSGGDSSPRCVLLCGCIFIWLQQISSSFQRSLSYSPSNWSDLWVETIT